MRCGRRFRRAPQAVLGPAVLVLALWTAGVSALEAQESTARIAVTLLAAEDSLEETAASVTRAIEDLLRQAGAGDVLRLDFLSPHLSIEVAENYYGREAVDVAIFGRIGTDETGVAVEVGIWRAGQTDLQTVSAPVDDSRALVLEAASAVVGRNLQEGRIRVEGDGLPPGYTVYVDGIPSPEVDGTIPALTGTRTVMVAVPGVLGDEVVATRQVRVEAGRIQTVTIEDDAVDNVEAEAVLGAATGRLIVGSIPPGADVFLDDNRIGTTPFERIGVPPGRYELRLERELFNPEIRLAEILPTATTELVVPLRADPTVPAVQSLLRDELSPLLTGFGSLLVRSGYGAAAVAGTGDPSARALYESPLRILEMAVVGGMHLGHLAAGDLESALIINAVSAFGAGFGLSMMLLEARYGGGGEIDLALTRAGAFIGLGIWGVPAVLDALLAPAAALRHNEAVLERIGATGSVPDLAAPLSPRFLVIEALGGSLARIGVSLEPIPDYLSVNVLAGAGLTSVDPVSLAGNIIVDLTYFPLGRATGVVRQGVVASAGVEAATSGVGLFVGIGVGFEARFGTLDLFLRSRLLFGLTDGAADPVVSVGVRL